MDPISLIVGALAAGAAAGLSDTASTVVQDGYTGSRELVRRRLAGRPAAQVALAEHESAPEVWHAPLVAELETVGAGTDEALVAAAQRVMAIVDAAGTICGEPARGTGRAGR